MIEVGKKYIISIEQKSRLASDLWTTFGERSDAHRIHGEVTHLHSFGFIFKLDVEKFPKAAEVNVLWNILKWIIPDEEK